MLEDKSPCGRLALIQQAIHDGLSWAQIGVLLGVSKQAAQQFYKRQLRKPKESTVRALSKLLHTSELKVNQLMDELRLSILDPDLVGKLNDVIESQKCLNCGKLLGRYRVKFCSDSCMDEYQKRRADK